MLWLMVKCFCDAVSMLFQRSDEVTNQIHDCHEIRRYSYIISYKDPTHITPHESRISDATAGKRRNQLAYMLYFTENYNNHSLVYIQTPKQWRVYICGLCTRLQFGGQKEIQITIHIKEYPIITLL
jgi:hypothetical protein